jgi:serine/threonine protein kinase
VIDVMTGLEEGAAAVIMERIDDAQTLESLIGDVPADPENPFDNNHNLKDELEKVQGLMRKYGPILDAHSPRPSSHILAEIDRGSWADVEAGIESAFDLIPINSDPILVRSIANGWGITAFYVKLHEILISLLPQIDEAIGHMSKRGILHRDLTGKNILIERLNQVKVIDFGSAIRIGQDKPLITPRRQATPEQHLGIYTEATDYWALPMIANQMLREPHPISETENGREAWELTKEYSKVLRTISDDEIILPVEPNQLYHLIRNYLDFFTGFEHRRLQYRSFHNSEKREIQNKLNQRQNNQSFQLTGFEPTSSFALNEAPDYSDELSSERRFKHTERQIISWVFYMNLNPKTRLYFKENPIRDPREFHKQLEFRERRIRGRDYTVVVPKAA